MLPACYCRCHVGVLDAHYKQQRQVLSPAVVGVMCGYLIGCADRISRSFRSIHNVVDGGVTQAMWQELEENI